MGCRPNTMVAEVAANSLPSRRQQPIGKHDGWRRHADDHWECPILRLRFVSCLRLLLGLFGDEGGLLEDSLGRFSSNPMRRNKLELF